MGKADAERDYYGDLELEPTADPNEIKRHFKKLGMLQALKNNNKPPYVDNILFKLSNIIPTGTLAMRWNATPSFKSYNPPMKS